MSTSTTTTLPDWLKTLNPEQLGAVMHFTGPALVLAGAGSGKTRVLTVRIAHLIQGHRVSASQILAITFTNKAAREMRERLEALLGGRLVGGPWVGTFHAFGAWILRQHGPRIGLSRNFSILDAEESLKLIKKACERLDIDTRDGAPQSYRSLISAAKNQLLGPDDMHVMLRGRPKDESVLMAPRVYAAYQTELERSGALDFDDLLLRPVQLLRLDETLRTNLSDRFRFILIDEYQDTNHAQSVLVRLIGEDHGNVMAVGDPDQAIYGFRGADIQNILEFERAFPGARVIRLERNYRSTGNILEAANGLIVHNRDRKPKSLRPVHDVGEKITVAQLPSDLDEARWIADRIREELSQGVNPSDIAVLYRTNAQSRMIEEALRRAGISYRIVGGLAFYQRREVKDALAYLRLIANPGDSLAFARCVNYPKRGIGEASQEKVFSWAEAQGVPILEAAVRADEIDGLTKKVREQLRGFAEMVSRFTARASVLSIGDLLEQVLAETEFKEALLAEGDEGGDRVENIEALLASAAEFDPIAVAAELDIELGRETSDLDLFLQQVALVSEGDEQDENVEERVTLMTLHASKGLEFPVVFVAGLEDGLLPHSRSFMDRTGLEEERRLLYVGITRAMERLHLSWARMRRFGGSISESNASPFLAEIPPQYVAAIRPYLNTAGPHGGGFIRRQAAPSRIVRRLDAEDRALSEERVMFGRGECVVHPLYGEGTVSDVHGAGPNGLIVVDFGPPHGKRILQQRTSELRRGDRA